MVCLLLVWSSGGRGGRQSAKEVSETVIVEQVVMKPSELCVGLFWGHGVVFGSDALIPFSGDCIVISCKCWLKIFVI